MDCILDAPSARQQSHRLSVESYHHLGDIGLLSTDVELLDGYIIKKMPKSPLHRLIVRRLFDLLIALLPAGFTVNKEDPLTTISSEPEPDISVVRGGSEDYAQRHPATAELVIEVAVNSEEIDLRKAPIYAEAGVKEYWIVEPAAKQVIVFRSPKGRVYEQRTVCDAAQVVTCAALPDVRVVLAELFA